MPEYDAIVYDLDGTLVELAVNWDEVRDRCGTVLRSHGIEAPGASIWEQRELAAEADVLDQVDEVITEFERTGATEATRLGLADLLPHRVPVAVCSLNAQVACEMALERFDLDRHVDIVVGRDTVETVKPDPEPLLFALDHLAVAPERAVFVGDSDSDRVTAERAGTEFQWARDWSG